MRASTDRSSETEPAVTSIGRNNKIHMVGVSLSCLGHYKISQNNRETERRIG